MLNYYGWKSFFMIMRYLKTLCAFSVTTLVPSIYPRTLFNSQSQNISTFDIISFKTWWRRKLYGWNLSTPTIKRLTFSLNPLMVHNLNLFIRPLVLVSSFDSYLKWPTLDYWHIHVKKVSHVIVSFSSLFFSVFLLILLCLFCFWVCWKIQKPIKSEKS